jgi:AraC-like DNA-binding protein
VTAASYALAHPPAPLRDHVVRCVGARADVGRPERQTELPVAGSTVILGLDGPWWIGATDRAELRRFGSFTGGLALAPAVSEHAGAYDLVQLDLTPLGTAAVLGVPGAALAGAVVELSDVLGPEADRLVERLAGTVGWRARFAVLERWLRGRVAAAEAERPVRPDVAWACRRLEASGGRLAIGALQRELGCSRRHLSARFTEQVGIGPKAYARLLRFSAAASRLRAGDADLARVAAECGFSDQAHLSREVRAIGHATPAELVRRGTPVTSVQA